MIAHAVTIIRNELRRHLGEAYGIADAASLVRLGNIAEGVPTDEIARETIVLSVVNIKEDRSLRNIPRANVTLGEVHEHPPVFLGLTLLASATHARHTDALLAVSQVLRYFQSQPLFTQDTVAAASISADAPANPADQLAEFKCIVDIQSLSLEEVHHLWASLGGKQYPFAVYQVRLLDLKFRALS